MEIWRERAGEGGGGGTRGGGGSEADVEEAYVERGGGGGGGGEALWRRLRSLHATPSSSPSSSSKGCP